MRTCGQCGKANDGGARFCSWCGGALAGDFTRALGVAGRHMARTAHFELHMPAGGFAQQRAAEIGVELEDLVAALTVVLGLPDDEHSGERSRVYLGEALPDPENGERTIVSGSWVVSERLEVWSIYRPDAPGVELDRAVVRLLVLRAADVDLATIPFIWAGLTGLCQQRLGSIPPAPVLDQQLVAESDGRQPALSSLWEEHGQGFSLSAISFLGFLRDRYGPEALSHFVSEAAGARPEAAERRVYRGAMERLQKAWWKEVHKSGTPKASGIGRFLRSSLVYLRPYWKQEIGIFALLGINLAFQQVFPRAQALLIDNAILPRDFSYLFRLILILFGLVVLSLLAGVLNSLLTARVSESVLRTLRERMFAQLQRASHRFYDRMGSGDIISRFSNDLRSVEQGLTGTLTQGSFLMLSLVASTIHILLINWILGVLVLLTLPLFLISTRLLGPRAQRASLEFSQEQAMITGILQEDLAAQSVVKAYNLQALMIRRFGLQARALFRSAVRVYFLGTLFGVTANLLTTAVQVTVLGLGGYFVIQGRLPLGNLIEFLALLGLVIGPVQSVSGLLQGIQIATASMDRVEEILNLEPDVRDAADAVEIGPLSDGIRFEHVSFSYRGDQPQVDDLNFEIPAGKTVAFVGPSGSGKSTVINLLLRFYRPDSGRVLVDGHDLAHVTLQSLRRQMGTVFQENFLFDTSVRENLRYGREDASDDEIEEAAKQAQIDETILQMPAGYDTHVGERGASLSGGQRQRLAIARAILRQPSVLVLDEATSALDARTENAITQTLTELTKGRTTVSVTHRLTAAANADRIIVLDRGRMVEQGTHEELLEANGLYRRLYEEQGGGLPGARRALEVAYLRSVPAFADVDVDVLEGVAAFLRAERAGAGDVVVSVGDEGDKLYLIVSGELEVLAEPVAGRERVLATLGSGNYFGEVALLFDVPRTATVRARTPSQLLTLDKQTLLGLFETIPGLRQRLEATVAERAAALPPAPRLTAGDFWDDVPDGVAVMEVLNGPQLGRRFSMDAAQTSLGRNLVNDIVLPDPKISGFHAVVARRPDRSYEVADKGSTNGTIVNGRRISEPAVLGDGDTIRIGDAILAFHSRGC